MFKIWRFFACKSKDDDVDDYHFGDHRDLTAKRMLLHEFQDIMVKEFRRPFKSTEIQEESENQLPTEKREEPIYVNQLFLQYQAEEEGLSPFMFESTSGNPLDPSYQYSSDSDWDSEVYKQDEAAALVRKSTSPPVYDVPESKKTQSLEFNLESNESSFEYQEENENVYYPDSPERSDSISLKESLTIDIESDKFHSESPVEVKPSITGAIPRPYPDLDEINKFLTDDDNYSDEITIWDATMIAKDASRVANDAATMTNDATKVASTASKGAVKRSSCRSKLQNLKNFVLPRGVDPRQFNPAIILELKAKFNKK